MHLTRLLKYRLSVRFNVFPEPQILAPTPHNLLQHLLALDQSQIPRRMTIQMKQIEDEVCQRLPRSLLKRRLQIRKASNPIFRNHHHLTIKNRLLCWQRPHKRSDSLHSMRPIQPGTRQQLNQATLFARLDTIAVELNLMQPTVARRRRLRLQGKLRCNKVWQLLLWSLAQDRTKVRDFSVRARSRLLGIETLIAIPRLPLGRILRVPNVVFTLRNLLHSASGHHTIRLLLRNTRVRLLALKVVMLFDQQPIRLALIRSLATHANQRPLSFHLRALQDELQRSRAQSIIDVGMSCLRLPRALIPHHHRPAAILALRNNSLKAAIVDRMIFHLH